jgi:nucleoside-diphosphate-sugar epimerase
MSNCVAAVIEGFIGSPLADRSLRNGYRKTGLDGFTDSYRRMYLERPSDNPTRFVVAAPVRFNSDQASYQVACPGAAGAPITEVDRLRASRAHLSPAQPTAMPLQN